MNEPYRLRYTNQLVGAFLLITMLIALVALGFGLRAQEVFAEKDLYWIKLNQDDLQDLNQGVEIMMLGERIGEIEDVQYMGNTDLVRVNLAINSQKSGQIFENSVLVPDRKFGLGSPVLYIRRGKSDEGSASRLPPGSEITVMQNETDRLEQMANEVKSVSLSVRLIQEKLNPTLTTVDDAASDFSTSLDKTLDPAMNEIQSASKAFRETNITLTPKASEALDTIKLATEDLQTRLGGLTEKVEAAD